MARPKRYEYDIQKLALNLRRLMRDRKLHGAELGRQLTALGDGEWACSESLASKMKNGKVDFSHWVPRLSKLFNCEIGEFYK